MQVLYLSTQPLSQHTCISHLILLLSPTLPQAQEVKASSCYAIMAKVYTHNHILIRLSDSCNPVQTVSNLASQENKLYDLHHIVGLPS